jgi:outer membrane protein assembly factor BamB
VLSTDGATLFVGSGDNKIYAIATADGTKRWDVATGGDVYLSPVLSTDGATLFVGSGDNKIYAIATADGMKRWDVATGGAVYSPPVLSTDGATLFVGVAAWIQSGSYFSLASQKGARPLSLHRTVRSSDETHRPGGNVVDGTSEILYNSIQFSVTVKCIFFA